MDILAALLCLYMMLYLISSKSLDTSCYGTSKAQCMRLKGMRASLEKLGWLLPHLAQEQPIWSRVKLTRFSHSNASRAIERPPHSIMIGLSNACPSYKAER